MKEYYYKGIFAGQTLNFAFRHEETVKYFSPFLVESESPAEISVRVPISDIDFWAEHTGTKDNAYTEYSISVYRASDALLAYDRVVFHAAAFQWHGRAWLLAADSGTGKSTQLMLWQRLYGDEIQVINGDKPIIKRENDGSFTVHPSPWKGKERIGSNTLYAPLGGIVLLKQGNVNAFTSLSPANAARSLLTCFFSSYDSRENLLALCRLEEQIILSVPLWQLTNLGDESSAVLTHDMLLNEGV